MLQTASLSEVIKFSVKPSILGAALLLIVYLGLVFLGAHFAELTINIDPEFMLPTIAKHVLGDNAALFIGIVMLLSCITTAVALNNIYAKYLCFLFRLQNNKFPFVLLGTTVISYLVSLCDFKGIAAFLVPALEVSYPSIIALTILGIITRKYHGFKICAFYGIVLVMIANFILR